LLVSFLNVLQHYVAFFQVSRRQAIDWQIANPLLAGLVMAVVVWGLPLSIATGMLELLPGWLLAWVTHWWPSPQRYVLGGLGILAYAVVVLGLIVVSHGGTKNLRDGFFEPLVS
jgi:hypothetical protein